MTDPYTELLIETPFDPAEVLRWCCRHQADVRFKREGGHDYVVLVTPLRNPAGEIDKAEALIHSQRIAPRVLVELVARTRQRLNLE